HRHHAAAPVPARTRRVPARPPPAGSGTPKHTHADARQRSRSDALKLPLWLPFPHQSSRLANPSPTKPDGPVTCQAAIGGRLRMAPALPAPMRGHAGLAEGEAEEGA